MTLLNNKTLLKESSMLIKLIKLLGVFLCCAILGIVFYHIIFETCVILEVGITSIRLYKGNFLGFAITICPPIVYLCFIDKKLGGKIRSSFSFCPISFLITTLLVIFRLIYFFLITDERLHIVPTCLKQWVLLHEGDLYIESILELSHLSSLSDLFWKGMLPLVIIAGIGEELIFRGILQNIFLKKTKKPWVAIVMAAILFTMMHGTIYNSIKIFLMGLLLGIIYHITNNIYLAIFAHMLNNGICVFIMFFLKDNKLTGLDPISNTIHKLYIWQVTLVITICMFFILFLIKKLMVVQHNRPVA